MLVVLGIVSLMRLKIILKFDLCDSGFGKDVVFGGGGLIIWIFVGKRLVICERRCCFGKEKG